MLKGWRGETCESIGREPVESDRNQLQYDSDKGQPVVRQAQGRPEHGAGGDRPDDGRLCQADAEQHRQMQQADADGDCQRTGFRPVRRQAVFEGFAARLHHAPAGGKEHACGDDQRCQGALEAAFQRGIARQAGVAVQGSDEADHRKRLQYADNGGKGCELEALAHEIKDDRKDRAGGCSLWRGEPLPGQDGDRGDSDVEQQTAGDGFPIGDLIVCLILQGALVLPPDNQSADRQQYRADC